MASNAGEGSVFLAEKLVDEAFNAAYGEEEDGDGGPTDGNLVKAIIQPKFEHIRCESLQTESAASDDNQVTRTGDDLDGDKLPTALPGDDPEGEDVRKSSEDDAIFGQEDVESGIEVTQDDSWEELHLVKQESVNGSSVKRSGSLDRGSFQEIESLNGMDEDPIRQMSAAAAEGELDVSAGYEKEEDLAKKMTKKEKGFFSSMFKRKPKPNSAKDATGTSKEPKSGLDKKKSRSSLFLFGSNSDLSSAGKQEQASPESGEPKSPGKDTKATTPQTESPTKGFFSFGGARKRKPKKAESDGDTLSQGSKDDEQSGLSSGNQDLADKLGDTEKYFKKVSKVMDSTKKLKTQIWSSVVTIVLIDGKKLLPMDDNGFSDPYVKFRLGNERYKSRYKTKTLNPKWLEQFDLHMFDDQTSHLEIAVYDHDTGGRDDIMGRAEIDLSTLEPEKTHTLDVNLEDGAGTINLLLSISGTSGSETVSDLANYVPDPAERERIIKKYSLLKSFKGLRDIGWLQVKVIKAHGLASADIGGKSDPFCVVELVNTRLQTQTEYKTLNPDWGKVFTLNIKDVHSVLEITVYDEDRDKKFEFLGKVSIPLLRVRPGERRWYQLKDRKLMLRARGAIQLEMDLVFNNVKAAVRTFTPRECKYMQPEPKFKLAVMKRNIDRVRKIAESGVEAGKFLESCFSWESKPRSVIAFAVFLIIVFSFELYMVPLTLLIIFVKNLLVIHIVGNLMKDKEDDEYMDDDDDDDEDEKDIRILKEDKKSFKDKLQSVQDVSLQVQEGMDMVASMGERVKNTFNWTVPWLSWLAVLVLTIGVIVLYIVPLRFIIMAWGINKFTKKLRNPNAIPNNEVLDFLSRVPSDRELVMYREFRPDPSTGVAKKKRS